MFRFRMKRRGAAAIEAIILTPLMLMIFMFCLYFLFLCLSYLQYNNTANLIAQTLNMRQSGYRDYSTPTKPLIIEKGEFSYYNIAGASDSETTMQKTFDFINGATSEKEQPKYASISASNDTLLHSSYKAIQDNIERMYCPGSRVESIKIRMYRDGKELTTFPTLGMPMSNTIIKVDIHFKSFGIPIDAHGYSIIS